MEYKCVRIDKNLLIDGDLEKPEWKRAETVSLVDTVTGGRVKRNTAAKLLWSHDFLYMGFHCEDDFICAAMTGYNDRLYEEDVVEIFIDDDRDQNTYIEIEINPLNAVLHYHIQNNLAGEIVQFARVQKVVSSAVVHDKEKKSFTVELAVPFSEFITAQNNPPTKDDRWLFNLYRIDRPETGAIEYSAWSPTGLINFHVPCSFGELIFL